MEYLFKNGKTVKKLIITLLSVRWPLSVNDIYRVINKELRTKVTYQAVHKAVKELVCNGSLLAEKKKYLLNTNWLNDMRSLIEQVDRNYIFSGESIKLSSLSKGSVRHLSREQEMINILTQLVPIFKSAFKKHNIFERNEREVLNYLIQQQERNNIIAFSKSGLVIGAVIFENREETSKYERWSVRHFACAKDIDSRLKAECLKLAITSLKQPNLLIKVELDEAETEKEWIEIYRSAGLKEESILPGLFRPDENVIIANFT